MDDKILRRIKKCLALSKSSNEHEAAALRQAQKLMKKHSVTAEDVSLADVGRTARRTGRTDNPTVWLSYLVATVAKAFGVRAIYGRNVRGKQVVNFVGIKPRDELAGYAYDVLFRQLRRQRQAHYQSLSRHKRSNRIRRADLFAQYWAIGVMGKVTAFAVASKEDALMQRAVTQFFPGLTKVTLDTKPSWNCLDLLSALAGKRAGKNARLDQGLNPGASPTQPSPC